MTKADEELVMVISGIVAILLLIPVGWAILAFPLMLLWNWLMPQFGLPVFSFWVMWGFVALFSIIGSIIFKGGR